MHFQLPGGHLAEKEPLPPGVGGGVGWVGGGGEGGDEDPKNRPTATPGDSGTFGCGRV